MTWDFYRKSFTTWTDYYKINILIFGCTEDMSPVTQVILVVYDFLHTPSIAQELEMTEELEQHYPKKF